MGIIDFELEPHHMKVIKRILRRRGLKPDPESEWKIHGPHGPELSCAVYVGYAYKEAEKGTRCICPGKVQFVHCPAHRRYYCVVIHPKAVYKIEDPSVWWKDLTPENRIYTAPKDFKEKARSHQLAADERWCFLPPRHFNWSASGL